MRNSIEEARARATGLFTLAVMLGVATVGMSKTTASDQDLQSVQGSGYRECQDHDPCGPEPPDTPSGYSCVALEGEPLVTSKCDGADTNQKCEEQNPHCA
jgi:hypothetical protein